MTHTVASDEPMPVAEWYQHSIERMNYWEGLLMAEPRNLTYRQMVNAWQREMTIAYFTMAKAKRRTKR